MHNLKKWIMKEKNELYKIGFKDGILSDIYLTDVTDYETGEKLGYEDDYLEGFFNGKAFYKKWLFKPNEDYKITDIINIIKTAELCPNHNAQKWYDDNATKWNNVKKMYFTFIYEYNRN
jgi:hypothetical protein